MDRAWPRDKSTALLAFSHGIDYVYPNSEITPPNPEPCALPFQSPSTHLHPLLVPSSRTRRRSLASPNTCDAIGARPKTIRCLSKVTYIRDPPTPHPTTFLQFHRPPSPLDSIHHPPCSPAPSAPPPPPRPPPPAPLAAPRAPP